ncbi:50S ribosomal protein L17 [Rubrivirga marina]|uniref:Large ribosomal subunit protein bL17 n=1 Tax=Rubrivirga marina TaxID=1196024 RepID=A0A271J1G2_9BACT|nr:50S ribosomal protein L17 [Rubrivirga marina]
MKHGKKILKIGRTASHRKATLQSMSAALLEHKRITTTFGKAKALRRFVEPIITHGKDDSTHSRRQAFRKLNDKAAVKRLYDEVAPEVGDRPGGYVRIVKLGQRAGDAAEMAVVELVDFNDVQPEGTGGSKKRTRRGGGGGRRRSKSSTPAASTPAASTPTEAAPAPSTEPAEAEPVEETPADETTAEAPASEESPVTDAPAEDAPENPKAEAAGSDAATPDPAGAVQVPPHADEHPDAAQGAPTQTGEPGPGADAENLGRSHDNR